MASKLLCPNLNGQEICGIMLQKTIFDELIAKGESISNLAVKKVKTKVPGFSEPQIIESVLVGYIAMPTADNKSLPRVLLDPNMEKPGFTKSMNIMKLTKVLSDNMSKLINRQEPKFKFSNEATADYYLNLLDKAISAISAK